jgi:hypothetical protein
MQNPALGTGSIDATGSSSITAGKPAAALMAVAIAA